MCPKLIKYFVVKLTLLFPLSVFIDPSDVSHLWVSWCLTSRAPSETGSAELEPSGGLTDLCSISWAPGLYPVSLTHWWHDLCRLLCSFLDHQFQFMLLSCPHCANEIFIPWIHRISAIHQHPSIHRTSVCSDFLFRGQGSCFPKMEILPYCFLWTENRFLSKAA